MAGAVPHKTRWPRARFSVDKCMGRYQQDDLSIFPDLMGGAGVAVGEATSCDNISPLLLDNI